ncbi:hypothetical protein DFH07DRAFT_994247 [Mycena maculata]|uniref:Uncharacterized protein n=1 Tax=Mycena maculata TaxID=230809 RepID=A0AAD7HXR0_9AGAR|nr:hypothetical protein DFH07DRAFT_994247 [Mycena maculata]
MALIRPRLAIIRRQNPPKKRPSPPASALSPDVVYAIRRESHPRHLSPFGIVGLVAFLQSLTALHFHSLQSLCTKSRMLQDPPGSQPSLNSLAVRTSKSHWLPTLGYDSMPRTLYTYMRPGSLFADPSNKDFDTSPGEATDPTSVVAVVHRHDAPIVYCVLLTIVLHPHGVRGVVEELSDRTSGAIPPIPAAPQGLATQTTPLCPPCTHSRSPSGTGKRYSQGRCGGDDGKMEAVISLRSSISPATSVQQQPSPTASKGTPQGSAEPTYAIRSSQQPYINPALGVRKSFPKSALNCKSHKASRLFAGKSNFLILRDSVYAPPPIQSAITLLKAQSRRFSGCPQLFVTTRKPNRHKFKASLQQELRETNL